MEEQKTRKKLRQMPRKGTYLRVFGLIRKVRKMTKNAETAKNTIQTVFDPSFFHTTLVGALGNRA